MNKERRKTLSTITARLRDCAAEIETVMSEEQDAFDNLPEGLQQGDKGSAMEEAIQAMEDAANSATDAADTLDQVG